ncbi:MAG: undecaprenyldiphospho-muramoylpentapeptide beta-N-acetylglucosaminyltransferase [Mobiluncus sp.]|uniref:undecaprenyldiphospho-muramoylpentapeptide beta-N-acetylglucosaminyltransferase n=1 Tax=Mobiluncus sp. TaxID=47293 RepID=UPI00258D8B5D|nr:undecaprenyldiphospho-muramoylpentapeptide beta-N-acetylglucosaminyltransferase [Mobiluncus sp.]MCI6584169.1 undecaprenyldiphospho-muramoylpentapeptide beta-N-acetylglucosaminyltransferase [Mobiluncus sp.]
MNQPAVVFAGGGTAGHVNPLLSTVAALKNTGLEFVPLVLGTKEGLESELVPAAGLEFLTIPRLPMPRRPSPDLMRLPVRLRRTVKELEELFAERGVKALVGFGGYVSTPAYMAARRLKIPFLVHEQNARPGMANKLGARWANTVALTFPGTPLKALHGKTEVTGLPLRPEILDLAARLGDSEARVLARTAAAEFFGLDAGRPTVLVTGGSLGALFLNQTLPSALLKVSETVPDLQVVHLTGKGKAAEVSDFVTESGLGDRYKVLDYLTEMHHALALADAVVCRAGAATVAENSALGIPALYVPLPVGNGEQALNARGVVEASGAFLLNQKKADPTAVAESVAAMLDPERNAAMRASAAVAGTTRGAANLAELIKEVL